MWFHFVSQVDSKGACLVGIKLVEPERSCRLHVADLDGPGLQAAFLPPILLTVFQSYVGQAPPTAQAIALSSEEEEMACSEG